MNRFKYVVRQAPLLCATPLFLAACASTPKPTKLYNQTHATARAAETAGAAENPQAKLHLKLARESLAEAKKRMGEDNREATKLLERAQADADLALALAREEDAKEDAREAQQEVEQLRKENL